MRLDLYSVLLVEVPLYSQQRTNADIDDKHSILALSYCLLQLLTCLTVTVGQKKNTQIHDLRVGQTTPASLECKQ